MAYTVSVAGLSSRTGPEAWSLEVPWWSERALLSDDQLSARVEDVSDNPSYADFAVVLTAEEALALHERFQAYRLDWMAPAFQQLDDALRGSAPPPYVRVVISEWESDS